MTTSIPWVISPDGTPGEVWNPTTGCTKGCSYCYARALHNRRHLAGMKGYEHPFTEPQCRPERLHTPLSRRKPTTYFVDSMGDLFDPAIPFEFIAAVFGVMAATPRHRYMILTKRPERMAEFFEWIAESSIVNADIEVRVALGWADVLGIRRSLHVEYPPWPLPNVWLGTSITTQDDADERIPHLLRCPAALRFVSAEPLLGEVCLRIPATDYREMVDIDWLICGAQSGPDARIIRLDWVRSLRDQCQAAGVPFFYKQGPEGDTGSLVSMPYLDGRQWKEVPQCPE